MVILITGSLCRVVYKHRLPCSLDSLLATETARVDLTPIQCDIMQLFQTHGTVNDEKLRPSRILATGHAGDCAFFPAIDLTVKVHVGTYHRTLISWSMMLQPTSVPSSNTLDFGTTLNLFLLTKLLLQRRQS